MTDATVMTIVAQAIEVALRVLAPVLLSALAVGVVVSLLQTLTQIQEQTLSFVPKLIVVCGVLVVLGGWMMRTMVDFVTDLWSSIPGML